MTYVELAEVDAGIVYITDARNSDHVEVIDTFAAAAHEVI
ncbi:MAG: molybdate ABC transporter substrate-binding protein, partial [Burkholderiales bacterium]|nr:molybdate ABC transporter substrate-binding protein [Burkholderiales bacterium]